MSYVITRGITLVAGRVTVRVKEGFRGFLGGLGGVNSGLLVPLEHPLPLWRSCTAPDLVPNTT